MKESAPATDSPKEQRQIGVDCKMFGTESGGNASVPQNKNLSSMQRRMNTPFLLTYRWYYFSICFIMFGVFMILNWILWYLLYHNYIPESLFLGFVSVKEAENIYDPTAVRYIYYIDGKTVNYFIKPASIVFLLGVLMLAVRKVFYRQYVDKELAKLAPRNEKQ